MKIYLIRHGDPDYENDTLTERGHREADALVAYLKNEGIHQVVSSPMGRARDTCRYTAESLGLDVTVEPWMAELSLRADTEVRRSAWDIPGHSIRNSEYLRDTAAFERVPSLPEQRVREILEELRRSSDKFLATLGYVRDGGVYRIEKRNDRKIAVFAHGGFGLSWLSVLLEIPLPLMWSGFFLHTSSVSQILFDERSSDLATPRCLMISALPHLFAASLEPGKAGVQANYT
ncbi:MAG: histidine phosphatase family protein [Spirochaetales bacterium]|nr:histidine phosphatase family protein [Spirochaetales bacterium]